MAFFIYRCINFIKRYISAIILVVILYLAISFHRTSKNVSVQGNTIDSLTFVKSKIRTDKNILIEFIDNTKLEIKEKSDSLNILRNLILQKHDSIQLLIKLIKTTDKNIYGLAKIVSEKYQEMIMLGVKVKELAKQNAITDSNNKALKDSVDKLKLTLKEPKPLLPPITEDDNEYAIKILNAIGLNKDKDTSKVCTFMGFIKVTYKIKYPSENSVRINILIIGEDQFEPNKKIKIIKKSFKVDKSGIFDTVIKIGKLSPTININTITMYFVKNNKVSSTFNSEICRSYPEPF